MWMLLRGFGEESGLDKQVSHLKSQVRQQALHKQMCTQQRHSQVPRQVPRHHQRIQQHQMKQSSQLLNSELAGSPRQSLPSSKANSQEILQESPPPTEAQEKNTTNGSGRGRSRGRGRGSGGIAFFVWPAGVAGGRRPVAGGRWPVAGGWVVSGGRWAGGPVAAG